MKKLFTALLIIVFLNVNAQINKYGYADHTWVYDKDGVLSTNCQKYSIIYNIQIKEAKDVFKPKFRVVINKKIYYTNGFYLNGSDYISFLECKTYKYHKVRFGEFTIYTSKYIRK